MKRAPLISMGLFSVACCLPALEWHKAGTPNDVMFGARALVVGWSGIFAGVFAWFANPVWAAGFLFALLGKPKIAALFSVVAMMIALTTFTLIGLELPGDEGGVTKTSIIRLLPGFYVWLASILSLLATSLLPGSR